MFPLFVLLAGLIVGFGVAYPHRSNKAKFYERILLSITFFSVGIMGFFFGFIPHVFFPNITAEKIGWPTGSPFQFEVGAHDGCWGILAFLSLYFRGGFLLATSLGWGMFLTFAGYGHLKQTVLYHNYAPYNYGYIAGDLLPALFLFVFAYLYYKHALKK